MSKFLNNLKSEQLGKWNHRLLAQLDLQDDIHGVISAPVDFETDFASINSMHNIILFPIWALVAGYGNPSAALHDHLYTTGELSRKECDGVLYRALRAEGVAKWRAWMFWAGVRIGGRSHYMTA